MAGKLIDMNKIRSVVRLYTQGKSKIFISEYLDLSRNTVKKYIRLFIQHKLTYEELENLDDSKLEELFLQNQHLVLSDKLTSLYAYFPKAEKELKKTGVTKAILWRKYKEIYPDGFQSSQFCEHFNRWSKRINVRPVMHMEHKAGDKMYVDYAGKTLQIVDEQSGEILDVQFFIAVLGASQYTYAEATLSQKKADFITSVENALHFFKGVPAAIVPDNLKSAVTKSNRYEPTLNETFLDFSEYYGTTILPARAYKPRDKSLVEGAVKILYTRIYSKIEKEIYFDLTSLNTDIWRYLKLHNDENFTNKQHSRSDLFEEIEADTLSVLPEDRYEIKQQSIATVMQNGHVLLSEDKHYYSVPYQYIRKKVLLIYSLKTVEIYHKYSRIAVYPRLKSPYNYTTTKDHLASTHQFMTEWSPQRFISWAESIDENVKCIIVNILGNKHHVEQGYKSCMGILSLEKKVGRKRLINACTRALEFGIYNYKIVQTILEKGLDTMEDDDLNNNDLPFHTNIRGKEYYK